MTYYIKKQDNLYHLGIGIEILDSSNLATNSSKSNTVTLMWYYRLGRINVRYLTIMQTSAMVDGLPPVKPNLFICEGCILGKQSKSAYPVDPGTRATEVLASVDLDLCGPMHKSSLGEVLYFLLFIDDFSWYFHVYFLQKKSVGLSIFTQYKSLVENQTNHKILFFRFDNGGEFTSTNFNKFCKEFGIQRQFSNSYNPTQNGVSECKNRTLVEVARSMLKVANLPYSFWTEAIATICYLQNLSFTKALKNTTPHCLWTGTRPDLSHLRIFGCLAYTHIPAH